MTENKYSCDGQRDPHSGLLLEKEEEKREQRVIYG